LNLLKELTPDIFEDVRSKMTLMSTSVSVLSCETETDINAYRNEFIDQLSPKFRFHPEFNTLHITTDENPITFNWDRFMELFNFENYQELKDKVYDYTQAKYLHLMIPQYSNSFIHNLINGNIILAELQELAVQADFIKLDDLLEYLRIFSESSSTSTTPKLKYVMVMNQNLDFETAKEVDDEIFEMAGQHSGILYTPQPIDSLEVTVKGDFTIHTCEASYSIHSPKAIRVGGTPTLEIVNDRLFLLADALIEVSANTSIVKGQKVDIKNEKFEEKNVFEIPLRSIKMTVFKNKESSVKNFESYCFMLEMLEESSPNCQNSLSLLRFLPKDLIVQLTNLHCICGTEGNTTL